MEFIDALGATPLDPDEAAGLIPKHIATQGDLNAWEEANIIAAEAWAAKQKNRDLLNEGFVRDLHRQMFGNTWRWAGTFRKSDKNIGAEWTQIPLRLRHLLDNTHYQIEHSVYAADELAIRLHHQLVWIHAFPNGNGRHARLMADMLIIRLGKPRFTWGSHSNSLNPSSELRSHYISALRAADAGQFEQLLAFARS